MDTGAQFNIASDLRIQGLDVYGTNIVLWSGWAVEVYEITSDRVDRVAVFDNTQKDAIRSIAIHNESLFLAVGNKIEVTNLQVS